MSEQLPEGPGEHPIIAGVGALVGVAIAVGLILGLVVLAGTRVLGLDGGSGEGSSGGGRSMYLPRPEKTPTETSPQITLAPGDESSPTADSRPSDKPTESASPRKEISLSASTTQAAPMEQFNLTGVYPGGEGAILTVQRFQDGSWQDFPATGSVSGEVFQIPVQTSQPGVNRFRVIDSDSELQSNEIRVTIG
ncbi:hypothetical protein [Nocardioides aquiterrae]|uniref:Bacterial spore germination immunoglobulin-like domain-containing protein n=1 Tax=Nocardioides aquiterrae TaxID=203799 RepID=A0ABN1U8E4_9ACTN